MNGHALIEGLQSASAGIAIGEAFAHCVENVVVGTDRAAHDQLPGVLQCLPYVLAAGHLADAGMAGIIANNDDIAREERRVRAR